MTAITHFAAAAPAASPNPWLFTFLQTAPSQNNTPLLVIIILVILIIALFWWGLTRNQRSETSTTTRIHDDHPPRDATPRDATTSAELNLDPADLNIGRVPDPQATAATLAAGSLADAGDPIAAAAVTPAAEEPDQPTSGVAEYSPPTADDVELDAVEIDATGTIPPGDDIQQDLPPTRLDPIEPELDPNAPPVLEDQSELVPDELAVSSTVPSAESTITSADDLKLIEGIGPRIAALLGEHGITTFAQLAATDVDHIQQILTDANLTLANPQTWPQQAQLAAHGRLDDLRQLQDQLKGGRHV